MRRPAQSAVRGGPTRVQLPIIRHRSARFLRQPRINTDFFYPCHPRNPWLKNLRSLRATSAIAVRNARKRLFLRVFRVFRTSSSDFVRLPADIFGIGRRPPEVRRVELDDFATELGNGPEQFQTGFHNSISTVETGPSIPNWFTVLSSSRFAFGWMLHRKLDPIGAHMPPSMRAS